MLKTAPQFGAAPTALESPTPAVEPSGIDRAKFKACPHHRAQEPCHRCGQVVVTLPTMPGDLAFTLRPDGTNPHAVKQFAKVLKDALRIKGLRNVEQIEVPHTFPAEREGEAA